MVAAQSRVDEAELAAARSRAAKSRRCERYTGGAGGGGGRGGAATPTTIAFDSTSFTVGTTSYKLDGATSYESARGTVTAKTSWKSDKLVIEETAAGANGPVTTTTSWYFDGDNLVRERSTPAADGTAPRVNKTYFKRS